MENRHQPSRLGIEDLLLLAAILLLPWAFGGVEIWAFRAAALLLVSGAVAAFWKRGPAAWGLGQGESRWLLPAVLLALWALVQLVPLPAAVIRAVSPGADRVYSSAFPGYGGEAVTDPLAALEAAALAALPEATDRALPPGPSPTLEIQPPECFEPRARTLSLQPGATQEAFFWYVALLLGFVTVRERVSSTVVYRFYRGALFGMAGGLALFALVQDRSWNGKIYWLRLPTTPGQAFGPYVSPTHFVGVMELCLPWLVGYAWSQVRRRGRDASSDPRFVSASLGAAICLVASVASASKAGAGLILLSLATLGLVGSRSWRTRVAVVVAGVVLVGGALALRVGTDLSERVESYVASAEGGHLLEGRLAGWSATIAMIGDFPVSGTGFGSFAEAVPRYNPAGSRRRFVRAHNDYLQVTAEGGAIAAGLVIWLAVAYIVRAAPRIRRKGRISLSRLGLALGLVSLAFHALVDFNHQIPANGLLFVTLAAMLVTNRDSNRSGGA